MAKSSVPEDMLEDLKITFDEFDLNHNGHISSAELGEVFKALNENVPGYKLRELIEVVDTNKNGTVEFDEFLEMYCSVTSKGVFGQWKSLVSTKEGIRKTGGTTEASAEGTTHSTSEAEQEAFIDWINSQLQKDPDCQQFLPIKKSDLIKSMKDGIIFCKMINLSAPKTIDERALNKGRLNAFLIHENNMLVLNSARAIGCTVVNIHARDISDGKEHLVLGLLWQIIRIGLFANITLQANPNIAALLLEGETVDDLLKLSPEELLLRWVNYHLAKSGSHKRINNFSGDIKDSEAYAILLSRIAPQEFQVDRSERIMAVGDKTKRAEMVLKNAEKINCRKFVTAKDICIGNSKLNMAFVANLFNNFPALDEADIDEEIEIEEYEETREEKTFRNWMNSLGVNPFVYHLYHDLKNGLILFQLYDDIKAGTVNWSKVNQPPYKLATGGNMKKIENCNLAVDLGKNNKYSLVGIGGEDIYNGTQTLVLALIWQMLRHYTMELLGKMQNTDGISIKDSEIIDWVNQKLAEKQKSSKIKNFKDPCLSSSMPVIDLIDAISPGSIDYSLVSPGNTDEGKQLNAQYAISMSRKIGARTYALPEDLVEVKPKMILTIFACLMTLAISKSQ